MGRKHFVHPYIPNSVPEAKAEMLGEVGARDAEERMNVFGLKTPVGRQRAPEEVGELVLFLASDESKYITGASFVIDGGNTLQEEYLGPYHPK